MIARALDARPRGGVRALRRRLRFAVSVRSRGRAGGPRRRVANLGRAGGAKSAPRAAARPLEHRRGRAVSAWNPNPLGAPAPARRARRSSAGGSPPAGLGCTLGGVPASSCAPRGAAAGASSPPPSCSATRWGCARPRSEASTARGPGPATDRARLRCEARGGPGDAALDGSDGLVGTGLDTRAIDFEIDGLRPYRNGSPASRIHWATVARTGEMVEHRLVAGADSSPLVVLDRCNPADQDSLDSAVRAAASICVHLAPAGGCTLLVSGERRRLEVDSQLRAWPQVHAHLASGRGRRRRARDSAPRRRPRRSSG